MDSLTFKFTVMNDPVTLFYLFICYCKNMKAMGFIWQTCSHDISNVRNIRPRLSRDYATFLGFFTHDQFTFEFSRNVFTEIAEISDIKVYN